MSCHIGRVNIAKNEGTIIFGNVINISPNNTTKNNEESGEGVTGEVSLDNTRFSLTIPNNPIVPDVTLSKRKKRNRNRN
ncbi:spore germination protein [Cohnella sp.]|uniref:spore germination protein n=1 Tax=Cohnella sp. TaxID=1883426 RepID=UPI003565E04F